MKYRETPCPNCGRPCGFEYVEVEPGKCQLWRWMNESSPDSKVAPRTLSDCFGHTSRRIRELNAKVVDLDESRKAAQRALSRHHAVEHQPLVEPDMFPDNARIE